MHNIIRNALEAADNRGIAVDARRVDGRVIVRVTDYGAGIPEDIRKQVFEPYFTTKSGGTGLGLAMVRQIIVEHHGSVRIENGETGGTVFVVSIPEAK